jgi:hypothetical protein
MTVFADFLPAEQRISNVLTLTVVCLKFYDAFFLMWETKTKMYLIYNVKGFGEDYS